jgi:hypothetical protein
VRVQAATLPPSAHAALATGAPSNARGGLTVLSKTFALSPSGPLPSPTTITLPLRSIPPVGETVVVATRETNADAWTYMAATLSINRRSIRFITTHFSTFNVLGFLSSHLVSIFKSDFLDQIDGNPTTTVATPTCPNPTEAVTAGYSTKVVAHTDTLLYCLGEAGSDAELTVANTRHFPLEVVYPHLAVINHPPTDYASLASLSHFASGNISIVAPGAKATFGARLLPGHAGGVETEMDGYGQSLYALQTGVNTLLEILNRFGVGGGPVAVTVASTLLGDVACLDSIDHGPAAMLTSCFSPKEIAQAFGDKAVFLIPIMVAGPLVSFFESEFQALIDQFNHDDQQDIEVDRADSIVSCTARFLFQAAIAKEHFSPDDPGYQSFGAQGPGAYGTTCYNGWAIALISRPSVGTTDGTTVFRVEGNRWVEVAETGYGAACALVEGGVPKAIALVLSHGVADSSAAGCTLATAAPPGIPHMVVSSPDDSSDFNGITPSTIAFSADATNIVTDLTWSKWNTTGASGQGNWLHLSCVPDCATGQETPYPATISLADPVDGVFTQMIETTSGPGGFITHYSYPSMWPLRAG